MMPCEYFTMAVLPMVEVLPVEVAITLAGRWKSHVSKLVLGLLWIMDSTRGTPSSKRMTSSSGNPSYS